MVTWPGDGAGRFLAVAHWRATRSRAYRRKIAQHYRAAPCIARCRGAAVSSHLLSDEVKAFDTNEGGVRAIAKEQASNRAEKRFRWRTRSNRTPMIGDYVPTNRSFWGGVHDYSCIPSESRDRLFCLARRAQKQERIFDSASLRQIQKEGSAITLETHSLHRCHLFPYLGVVRRYPAILTIRCGTGA